MISIICSIYNASNFLPAYLNHVNNQFLKNFEIIFVDANSSDDSVEIIEKFNFRKGILHKLIKEKTKISIYQAWNIAIKNCSGNYIVNWNADDILFPSALSTYKSYSQSFKDIDLFYGPCFLSLKHDAKFISNIYMWPEYSHQQLLQRCICGPFPLVKKIAVEKVGYFNENYVSSGDYDMWLKLSKNKFNFKKIPEVVGCFLDRPDSVSKSKISIAQQEDKEIQNLYA